MVSLGPARGFTFPLCGQCDQKFDGEDHRPLLLPCGDVFCKKCLSEQEDTDNQLCQQCQKSWSNSNIFQLPVVLDLENGGTAAAGVKGRKVPSCFPTCKNCQRNYNTSLYRPFLLPCGHCFCRCCLELLRNSGNSVCSVCRSDWATEDMTKLRCVNTLVHPSNVNSKGHQSPDDHNYNSWSHDEPSNYPRTARPGGGTEILDPKEACADDDVDSGVFSGGSSESGRSSVTSFSVSLGTARGFPFPLCGQCGQKFDGEDHRPLLLPCGDAFCKKCLSEQEDADNQLCQQCHKSWSHSNISQLPVVLDLENEGTAAAGVKGRKVPSCFPSCRGCRQEYNASSNRPFLLPCGHCFCRSCLQMFRNSANSVCSVCRSSWANEDMTKLRCVRTLIHPSNVNSEGHQSPNDRNYDSWSHDEPSNYPRTDRPGGGTEILAPKEACADDDVDSGVFSGGSSVSGRSSVTSSSEDGVTALSDVSSPSDVEVVTHRFAQILSGATAATSQNRHRPAQTLPGATAAKSPNGHQSIQTLPGATAATSQNCHRPTQTLPGVTAAMSPNGHHSALTLSSSTPTRRRNHQNPASAVKIPPESTGSVGLTQSNFSNARCELAAPRVTSQGTEQSSRITYNAPVIPPPPKKSQIFVRNTKHLTDAYQLDLKKDKVDTLMSLIFERTKFKPDRLVYEGHQLQEGRTLASYNIKPEATIYETCRIVGGGQNCRWPWN